MAAAPTAVMTLYCSAMRIQAFSAFKTWTLTISFVIQTSCSFMQRLCRVNVPSNLLSLALRTFQCVIIANVRKSVGRTLRGKRHSQLHFFSLKMCINWPGKLRTLPIHTGLSSGNVIRQCSQLTCRQDSLVGGHLTTAY